MKDPKEYTDLIAGFGENIDAYIKWEEKVPPFLKARLVTRQTAYDEIYVYAKPGTLSSFERCHLLELMDTEALPDGGGIDEEPPTDEADLRRDPGPVPAELLTAPGFIERFMDHSLKAAPYPNRQLAFAGAITMLAHLSGRRYRDRRNLRTNIYMIALAESGAGKDAPRKANINLADAVGLMPTMGDRFASAEGLEDALMLHPASFFQVDEADTLFKSLQEKDTATERIYAALLQFFTSSDTIYAMRKKALQSSGAKQSPLDMARNRGIREPHLVMLGTAIPRYFYQALTERALENGLLSRCLVIEADKRGSAGEIQLSELPEELKVDARFLAENGYFCGVDPSRPDEVQPIPSLVTVPEADLATSTIKCVIKAAEARYNAASDTTGKALWTRAVEKTMKLALLYAISVNPRDPLITPEAVRWGWQLVEHLTRRTLYQASMFVCENTFDSYRKKVLRILKEKGEMKHGLLLRRIHVDADTFKKIMDTLVESEQVKIIKARKSTCYKLI